MHKCISGLAICIVTFAMNAAAQTNTFPASGNVGIGTTSPSASLSIDAGSNVGLSITGGGGYEQLFSSTGGYTSIQGYDNATERWRIGQWGQFGGGAGFAIGYGTSETTALLVNGSGNVGIGTTNPAYQIDIQNYVSHGQFNGLHIYNTYTGGDGSTALLFDQGYAKVVSSQSAPGSSMRNLDFYTNNGSASNLAVRIGASGNVGIGTTSPGAPLEVNGSVKLTSGSGASITFQDGTVQSTAYTGVLCGGDYAEAVDVQGDRKKYEPGDVLVLRSGDDGEVEKSSEPYSTMVTGIFATKPGVIGRRETLSKSAQEIPMAMVGIVPAKVSAENGPIRRGDLLVTSSTPGYAMKGTDRSLMMGAVIGKALGSLGAGAGVIEVVVTLQ